MGGSAARLLAGTILALGPFVSAPGARAESPPLSSVQPDNFSDAPAGIKYGNLLYHASVASGVVYVSSEDGNLYAINQGGTLRERIFLQLALGAAYTPLSLGTDGRVYTQNAGILFVVGTDAKKRHAMRP